MLNLSSLKLKMPTLKQQSSVGSLFKSIAYLPLIKESDTVSSKDVLTFDGDKFAIKKDKFKKDEFIVANISSKFIINSSIELEIDDESLLGDILELKAYEELGLEQNVEYVLKYSLKSKSDDLKREYDVFALSHNIIHNETKNYLPKVPSIDYISSSPFLFKTLYELKKLDSNKAHCFIYFGVDDAFLAIYKNGAFLYFKSIDFSIKQLYDKFFNYFIGQMDFEDFIAIISTDGLKNSDVKYKNGLSELYDEMNRYLFDILIYAKRLHSLNDIDTIFLDGDFGIESDFYDSFGSFSMSVVSKFNFDYGFETPNEITHISKLALLYANEALYRSVEYSLYNFTIYKRPDPFFKTEFGKFVGVILISTSLMSIYPIYTGWLLKVESDTNVKLLKELKELSDKKVYYEQKIAEFNNQKSELLKKQNSAVLDYNYYNSILDELNKGFNKGLNKTQLMVNFVKELNSANVFTISINIKDEELEALVYSISEDEIANLIKNLRAKGFDIDIKKIYKDSDESFKSKLKVKLL